MNESFENFLGITFVYPFVISCLMTLVTFFSGLEVMVSSIVVWLIIYYLSYIYMFPTVIARSRNHKNHLAIFLLNLFFGFTIFGWFGSFFWAISN